MMMADVRHCKSLYGSLVPSSAFELFSVTLLNASSNASCIYASSNGDCFVLGRS
jgi:hypothetical protein